MNAAPPDQTDVVVIGGGPAGLIASLLLDQWQVEHILVEAQAQPGDHPQAHFINCRTMEIFRELEIDGEIRQAAAPLDEWRRYVYGTNLVGLPRSDSSHNAASSALLGQVDHFPSGPDHGISPAWECNLSQHVLVNLLREVAVRRCPGVLLDGWRAEVHENRKGVNVLLKSTTNGQSHNLRCRYVICADGAHSTSRKALGIGRIRRTPTLQDLLNIHFFSPELAKLLRRRLMAMLYFVYAPQGIGVFVTHSLERGEFVLQLPFFPPFENPEDFDQRTCAAMIDHLVGRPVESQIRSIRPWRLEAWVAERFRSRRGRCFLIGDAAHQLLPAGGFGMNAGIADAHNLVWKLARRLKAQRRQGGSDADSLLATYEAERRPVNEALIALSRKNFEKTLEVAAAIGLDWRAARWLRDVLHRLPLPAAARKRIFDTILLLGRKQVHLLQSDNAIGRFRRRRVRALFETSRTLPMRFQREDLGTVYHCGWLQPRADGDRQHRAGGILLPTFEAGARIPHFRLQESGSGERRQISSLDLAPIMGREHGEPIHVLMVFGQAAEPFPELAGQIPTQFEPFKVVHIGNAAGGRWPADFTIADDASPAVSLPRAALLRPDGHLAWVLPRGGPGPSGP